MTARTKNRLLTLGALVSALVGSVALTKSGLNAVATVDERYLHRAEFERWARTDSLWKVQLMAQLDSLNERVRQMKCGRAIAMGCR